MGGCATKPRELKEELAPKPVEEEKAQITAAAEEEISKEPIAVDVDEGQRKSLGHLFKESEEAKVAPETEEVTVKEAVLAPAVESKEEEEEEHPKTEEPPTVEKHITPTPVETSVTSESNATEEKQINTSPNADAESAKVEAPVAESPKAEQKEVVTEKENAELPPPSSTEKVEAGSPKAA